MVNMSRIGNAPIQVPQNVEVKFNNNVIVVKGPLGQLEFSIPQGINVELVDEAGSKIIKVTRPSDKRKYKALHGTTRAIINNMIIGVSNGFVKELEIHGVGYKAELAGNELKLYIGLTHPIHVTIPTDIKVEVPSPTEIKVSGIDKQKVGNFAAYIRNLKKPDAYKGKGIRYKGEQLKLKEIKTLGA